MPVAVAVLHRARHFGGHVDARHIGADDADLVGGLEPGLAGHLPAAGPARGEAGEARRPVGLAGDDDRAIGGRQGVGWFAEPLRPELEQPLPHLGRRLPNERPGRAQALAAHGGVVVRHLIGAAHDDPDRLERHVELVRHELPERGLDALPEFDLARVQADRAVLADLEPGVDVFGDVGRAEAAAPWLGRGAGWGRLLGDLIGGAGAGGGRRRGLSQGSPGRAAGADPQHQAAAGQAAGPQEVAPREAVDGRTHAQAAPPPMRPAASWTACTMRLYVPQRHRWPARAWRMSCSEGAGLLRSNAAASMICPGWQ
jgi:hypothetical protein